jgi:hypothetical protein
MQVPQGSAPSDGGVTVQAKVRRLLRWVGHTALQDLAKIAQSPEREAAVSAAEALRDLADTQDWVGCGSQAVTTIYHHLLVGNSQAAAKRLEHLENALRVVFPLVKDKLMKDAARRAEAEDPKSFSPPSVANFDQGHLRVSDNGDISASPAPEGSAASSVAEGSATSPVAEGSTTNPVTAAAQNFWDLQTLGEVDAAFEGIFISEACMTPLLSIEARLDKEPSGSAQLVWGMEIDGVGLREDDSDPPVLHLVEVKTSSGGDTSPNLLDHVPLHVCTLMAV